MTDANRVQDPGAVLAADMIKALVMLGDRIESASGLQAELKESVDQLVGHCEVFGRAMEIVIEKSEEGKSKWSLRDFAEAYVEAADEIMPTEEGEAEEDDDQ